MNFFAVFSLKILELRRKPFKHIAGFIFIDPREVFRRVFLQRVLREPDDRDLVVIELARAAILDTKEPKLHPPDLVYRTAKARLTCCLRREGG